MIGGDGLRLVVESVAKPGLDKAKWLARRLRLLEVFADRLVLFVLYILSAVTDLVIL
jgi:hypothetical protein